MIKICLEFYDRKTSFGVEDVTVHVPDEIIYEAVDKDEFFVDPAENRMIDYINCRPFVVKEPLKNYIIKNYPALEEKFDQYDTFFIGRHGLGPDYD